MKGLNKITCCLLAALLMPCAGHAENEQYGANFNNADIRQFVEIVGQHLGKTILIDPSVQGTISVRSNDTFSQQEYYQFFLSILDLYGYSVITLDNGFLKVVRSANVKTSPGMIADSSRPGVGDELVIYGERAVLRLLDKNSLQLSLNNLGMTAADKQDLENLIQLPHGIILVTGPTGSGKSTTLYAILSALNTPGRNILTVEDPVEYELEGIGQTQVNTRVDMSFARGLRAILRQDPDVVMVGEIRDTETAQIAVQASLTGHLVLSTLHTNSASGAVTRLRDMGVESFLLSSSLAGIIAQRLVRRLCPQCRQFTPVSPQQAQMFKYHQLAVTTIGTPVGCPHCHQSGYQGRMAIHEMMVVTPELRAAIHENVDEQALERLVRQQHKALIKNGLQKVISGDTSWDEVMRVASATLESEA